MTLSTRSNQQSITVTSNKGENNMNSENDLMNYPISESVRTDGIDLYIDTDALIHYLQTNPRDFRKLCERGLYHRYDKTRHKFPLPILIKGRSYWNLSEVREWELDQAQYMRENEDILTITQSFRDVMADSITAFRNELLEKLDNPKKVLFDPSEHE